jgi:hypothetical protein
VRNDLAQIARILKRDLGIHEELWSTP